MISPSHGYHSTDQKLNIASKFFTTIFYDVNPETGIIDYIQLEMLSLKLRPRIIVAGGSSYPRDIDYERISKVFK